ncbi:AAA family ATPase [Janibacter anophelis]|uniref:ATP-binding protein n=1 Tax=Janibacter anophelis TaxID=319054 RepID=UPI0008343294|nr:AAA family ATPase [Janibacter anophelis]
MTPCHLHITGASGSGTTTLGRALASAWAVPHADTDDYFWVPTTPPYTTKREEPERVRLMRDLFVGRDAWVLSGTLMGWGDELVEHFDAVVFLSAPHEERMDRLHAREVLRYGETIRPGGEREGAYRDFMDWAGGYEDPDFDGRNRAQHEQWLADLPCPVVRLDSTWPVAELVDELTRA